MIFRGGGNLCGGIHNNIFMDSFNIKIVINLMFCKQDISFAKRTITPIQVTKLYNICKDMYEWTDGIYVAILLLDAYS